MPVSRVVPFPKHKTPAFVEGTRELAAMLSESEIEALADIHADVEEPDEAIWIIRQEYNDAVRKAWSNLGRYKFSNFGYWSARVVFLGQLLKKCGAAQPANPFKSLVLLAREVEEAK